MAIKIGIHSESRGFSDGWIKYCDTHNIAYKIVNAYDSDIVSQLDDCDGFMWNWHHLDYSAQFFARQLTLSLEALGKQVFPDSHTAWHFDDKVGQKYLFESLGIPMIPSYCFYDKSNALSWAEKTSYPKVFKLSGGSASLNVRLVNNASEARKLIKRSFGKGFHLVSSYSLLKDAIWCVRRDKGLKACLRVIKRIFLFFSMSEKLSLLPIQRGYAYFQDFIPKNTCDHRLTVIGDYCYGVRRVCRKGDFRASGSGVVSADPDFISKDVLRLAFDVSRRLKSQCIALDIIYTEDGSPVVVECSYNFTGKRFYEDCLGYWDAQLEWHDEKVELEHLMMDCFIQSVLNSADDSNALEVK